MSDLFASTQTFDRALLGTHARGRVVALFKHAALLELGDGKLVTLLHPSRPLVPYGIQVPWADLSLRLGADASVGERRLRLASGASVTLSGDGVSLEPHCDGALDLCVLASQLDELATGLPVRTRALLGELPVIGSRDAGLEVTRAAALLQELTRRLAAGAPWIAFDDLVEQLCGFGPGQTPTGDDLLAGVSAAALRCERSFWLRPEVGAAFRTALGRVDAAATTPVARQMLAHARAGAFVAPLAELAGALGRGPRGFCCSPQPEACSLFAVVAKLTTVGAQTGSDMLAGVIALCGAILETSECDRRLS